MAERSAKEKMRAGEVYNSRDPELLALHHRARALMAAFNTTASTEPERRRELLEQLLGAAGANVWIEAPFYCDYGEHIALGANSFVNVNCVFLDCNRIQIGENALIGPGVHIYTAHHPLRAAERVIDGWTPASGTAPYRTQAAPVRIGRNVWVGGASQVMPGVTIGDNVTVGAGSLVTEDLPSDVLAVGRPCKPIRSLR